MPKSLTYLYKVYNQLNKGKLSDDDVLQYILALVGEYCETQTEADIVRWLKSVGTLHRDMKVNMPTHLREAWLHNQYDCMTTDTINHIIGLRRVPRPMNSLLLTIYDEMEVYQWGKENRANFYKLEKQYYSCFKVGREIKTPLRDLASLVLSAREDQQALALASDELEAAGYDKSAEHLRSGQKHLWTCSVFKGILGAL